MKRVTTEGQKTKKRTQSSVGANKVVVEKRCGSAPRSTGRTTNSNQVEKPKN